MGDVGCRSSWLRYAGAMTRLALRWTMIAAMVVASSGTIGTAQSVPGIGAPHPVMPGQDGRPGQRAGQPSDRDRADRSAKSGEDSSLPVTMRDWMAYVAETTVPTYPMIDDAVLGFGNDDLWVATAPVAVRRGPASSDSSARSIPRSGNRESLDRSTIR